MKSIMILRGSLCVTEFPDSQLPKKDLLRADNNKFNIHISVHRSMTQ